MASGGGGAGRWTWWSRSSRSMPAPAGASETGSGLRRKTGGAVKNQLRSFTHQRSPLDVGSGRTSSPSAIAVDVHVTLPKSGPRPALRPNVVKGPPKPGTELLEMERGRRKGTGGTQRPDVSGAKGSKEGGDLVELKTTCPRTPRCLGPGGVGGAW